MDYKGYFAKVDFDDEPNIFHVEVFNLRDVITFEGKTIDELRQAFHESVDDYLELCAEGGILKSHTRTGLLSSSTQSYTKLSQSKPEKEVKA